MLKQLLEHSENHNLLPDFQSAYHKYYSMETSLIRLTNDILWSMERQHITSLAILGLSAATVQNLEQIFGFCDKALKWFQNYLRPWSFRVNINGKYSKPKIQCPTRQLQWSQPLPLLPLTHHRFHTIIHDTVLLHRWPQYKKILPSKVPYSREKNNKHHGKHLNQNTRLDDINVVQTWQQEDQVHNVGSRQMLKHADTSHLNFGTTPHTMKQFDQIPQLSPRLLSHLRRTHKPKVQGSNAELNKDKGNKTQPHCSILRYPGADAPHFPLGLWKCTIVQNDQEVKIKIPKNSEHVCQNWF